MAAQGQIDMMDLEVLCMNGEGLTLRISCDTPGRDVRKMVSEKLPPKPGAGLALYHGDSNLLHHQSLKEQGIVGKAATLTCTFDQTDLYAAWCFLTGRENSEEFAL